MRVVFATAELAPLVSVGGLAEAATGLVTALREKGIDVRLVVPDYGGYDLEGESVRSLEVPTWAGPATARTGTIAPIGEITRLQSAGRVSIAASPTR